MRLTWDGVRAGAGPGARDQREPRAGVRRARAGAEPARRGRGAGRPTSGLHIEVSGEGADDVADAGEAHLVVRAMRAAFDDLGVRAAAGPRAALREPDPARARPRLVGGRDRGGPARGARAGRRERRGPSDVLPLANELEGHPDNVAPCLFGGLTIAWLDEPDGRRALRRGTAALCRLDAVDARACVAGRVHRAGAGVHRGRARAAAARPCRTPTRRATPGGRRCSSPR